MDGNELCRYIKLYHQTVYRAAVSLIHNGSEADDIVQETFVKLFNSHKSFESDEHCKAWLLRTAINLSKDLLRSFRYARTEELVDTIPAESRDERELVEALAELPQKYRAVIHLHYFEGYSAAETAMILGISTTAVTTRLARARAKLKGFMTAEELNDQAKEGSQ